MSEAHRGFTYIMQGQWDKFCDWLNKWTNGREEYNKHLQALKEFSPISETKNAAGILEYLEKNFTGMSVVVDKGAEIAEKPPEQTVERPAATSPDETAAYDKWLNEAANRETASAPKTAQSQGKDGDNTVIYNLNQPVPGLVGADVVAFDLKVRTILDKEKTLKYKITTILNGAASFEYFTEPEKMLKRLTEKTEELTAVFSVVKEAAEEAIAAASVDTSGVQYSAAASEFGGGGSMQAAPTREELDDQHWEQNKVSDHYAKGFMD